MDVNGVFKPPNITKPTNISGHHPVRFTKTLASSRRILGFIAPALATACRQRWSWMIWVPLSPVNPN
jgi:hypothetical protein